MPRAIFFIALCLKGLRDYALANRHSRAHLTGERCLSPRARWPTSDLATRLCRPNEKWRPVRRHLPARPHGRNARQIEGFRSGAVFEAPRNGALGTREKAPVFAISLARNITSFLALRGLAGQPRPRAENRKWGQSETWRILARTCHRKGRQEREENQDPRIERSVQLDGPRWVR